MNALSEASYLNQQLKKQVVKKTRIYRIISGVMSLLLVMSITLNIQLYLDKRALIELSADYQYAIITGENDLETTFSNKTLTRQEAELIETMAEELNKKTDKINKDKENEKDKNQT